MLLQKTGWRIKQFISHRRNNSRGESGESLQHNCFTDNKPSTTTSRRMSWLSQTSPGDVTMLQRTNSSATTRSRPLMPASTTAHSSASSLCNCECAIAASTNHSLFEAEPTPTVPDILYLPPLYSTNTSGDAQAWRLIFSENLSRSPGSCWSKFDTNKPLPLTTPARGLTFDLLEALAIDPVDEDRTPTQSIREAGDSDMEELSENVEQLIRETDEAFRAVGSALADAKAATEGWYDTSISMSKPVTRNVPISCSALKKEPRSPISRSMSVSKGKRKKSFKKKTTFLGRALRRVPPTPANTPPRWTLTDMTTNMVDVFSGKMFRTEVDEMLTPDRIQQIKNNITIETKRKLSEESTRSAETDGSTPTEPFHLESLSARITAAQKAAPPSSSPVLPPPAIPSQKHCVPEKQAESRKVQFADIQPNDTEMVFKDLNFPAPPRMPMSRSPSRHVQLLPTIPETSRPRQSINTDPQHPHLFIPSLPRYIILPSTPFTFTSPLFRHGSIRLERVLREPKPSSPVAEPLDWTAFQMAISGTIDDDPYERYGEEWEAQETEEDDIVEWWAAFGFVGAGRMVQEAPVRKRMKIERDMEGVTFQHGSSTGEISGPKVCKELAADVPKVVTDVGMARKGSIVESLPPSPMLDLVPPSSNRDVEVIPMGYNLSHDLGDFLHWETHHVQEFHAQQ